MHEVTHNKALLATFMMTLLYSLHYAIPLYATSSYLSQFFPSATVNMLYAGGSVVTILASIHFTKYLRRFHTYSFTLMVVITEILVTIALALTHSPILLGVFFVTHLALTYILFNCINIFIETLSPARETGLVRGIYLTISNFGILIAPFIGSTLLLIDGYELLYIVAACMLIPFIFLLRYYLSMVPDPKYSGVNMLEGFASARKNKDLSGVLFAVFALHLFYGVMVIYAPLYVTSLGISLVTYLSIVMPLALIPFVILPYELGVVADTKIGEKELLIGGMLIMTLGCVLISVTTTSHIFTWVCILVFSRIGSAMVEIMTFSYFFKKIHKEDAGLTTLFSNMQSFGIISVGVIMACISPLITTYPGAPFLVLAATLLIAVTKVSRIKDTL